MPNYNFFNLSPIDFEELVRDLLQKSLDLLLESFTSGRDDGIDLRYSKNKNNDLIVQCKRFYNFKQLFNNLKREKEKVDKLEPGKYILATSCGLTPKNKEKIKNLFNPYINETSDIYGKDDLNNLLGKFQDIERKHFKLWLVSTNILDKIIHNDIINRSIFELEQIEQNIKIYVPNESYNAAIKILNESNFVIISGIPGIGKTILAKMLVYHFLENDFNLVVVSKDIEEAEKIFQKGKKQIFYYDDFLGTNFLKELLQKNEDKRILSFIKKVSRSSRKKIIFTTREYILNQAKTNYESFCIPDIDISKCMVDLEKYTRLIRAKILYNHLYFSNIQKKYIERILIKNKYLEIIDHSNYSPRIIEFMTDDIRIKSISPQDYLGFFLKNLDNPEKIWKHAFENQISVISRYVLYAMIVCDEIEYKKYLEKVFENLIKDEKEKFGISIRRGDFDQSLKELELTFLKVEFDGSNHLIWFQNNSIRDFLINHIKDNKSLIKSLIKSAIFLNPLTNLLTINTNNSKNKILLSENLVIFFEEFLRNNFDYLNIKISKLFYSKYREYNFILKIYSKIEKLLVISEFFDLKQNKIIRKIIIDKFKDINLDHLKLFNQRSFIKLFENISCYIEFDKTIILDIFFEGNLETYDDIYSLIYLKDIFEDELDKKFYKERINERMWKIKYIIDNRVSNCLENESENEKSILLSDIEYIGENLEIDFCTYIDDLKTALVEENEEDSTIKNLYYDVSEKKYTEEDKIINMFDSLKEEVKENRLMIKNMKER